MAVNNLNTLAAYTDGGGKKKPEDELIVQPVVSPTTTKTASNMTTPPQKVIAPVLGNVTNNTLTPLGQAVQNVTSVTPIAEATTAPKNNFLNYMQSQKQNEQQAGTDLQFPVYTPADVSGYGTGSLPAAYVPTYSYQGSAGSMPTWNYTVAQPGAFSYDGVAPGAFSYDVQRPGDFQYDAARPADFSWDDSGRPGEFTYDPWTKEYVNNYQDRINAQVDSILNRDAFSYDYNTDPLYQQYAEAYNRNGQAAMQDTLAQMAARTGGLASSYAGTAAQGTYNQYMQALNDKIPELYQMAYNMYRDDETSMRNNLSMLQNLENTDYSRYMDQLSQYNTDRNMAYNQYLNGLNQWNADRNFAYNQYADQLNQWNADRNFAYGQYQDQLDRWNADRDFAYGQYQDELARYNADRNFAYNQYQDELAQWNQNRNFDYGTYADQLNQWNINRNFEYNQQQDALAQSNWERNFAYNQQQDALDRAESQARFQYQTELDRYNQQMAAQQAASGSGNGSSSGSGNGSSSGSGNSSGLGSLSSYNNTYDSMYRLGAKDGGTAYDMLLQAGYNSTSAKAMADYYESTWLKNNANNSSTSGTQSTSGNGNRTSISIDSSGNYTWNGKTYTSYDALGEALYNANLTQSEWDALKQKLPPSLFPSGSGSKGNGGR